MTDQSRLHRLQRAAHARKIVPLTVAAAVAASLGTTPALSQEPAADVLTEIVVTARYREENIQTTPLAITALSVNDLDERQLTNVDDIGLAIPNAFIRAPVSNYGPTTTIGLRGIVQHDYSYAFEPAVGIYIDDIYHGTLTGSSMDLLDLERVEVLRGPQGTLFGKNSMGGAIRLISRRPQGDNSGSVEATYGQFNRIDLRAVGDFALIEDKAFVRVVGLSKRRDGYGRHLDFTCEMKRRGTPELAGIGDGIGADGSAGAGFDGSPDIVPVGSAADNNFSLPQVVDSMGRGGCALGSLGGQQASAARLMLRLLPSDRLEVNFAADYSAQNDDPPVETLLSRRGGNVENGYSNNVVFNRFGIQYTADDRFLTGDPYSSYATYGDIVNSKAYDTDQTLDSWGVSAIVDYEVTDKVRAKLVAGYRTYEANWINDSDLTPFGLTQTNNLQEHLQRQIELQVSGLLAADRLEWTTGLFFYNSRSRSYYTTNFEAFASTGALPNFIADDGYTSENKSAFLHLNYQFTDHFSMSAGLRYTDEGKSNTFNHIGQITVPYPLLFGDNRLDYNVVADFKFTDSVFAYATVATGFRSPGVNPRISTVGQLQPISGEEAMNYEIGAKFDLFDRRLRINTAAFYMDYDPRLFQTTAAQCNDASDPDPGQPFFLGPGGLCPAGTPRGGQVGLSPWFYYLSVPAKVKGAELELSAFPVDNLAINYSFGYNRTTVDVDSPLQTGYVDSSVYTQPKFNMSGGIQYTIPFVGGGKLTPRLDAFYQGYRTNGPINRPQVAPDWIIGGYTLVNARIAYDTPAGNWQVALAATNLLDKFYWQQLGAASTTPSVPAPLALSPSIGRVGTPGLPRMWAVTLKKTF